MLAVTGQAEVRWKINLELVILYQEQLTEPSC